MHVVIDAVVIIVSYLLAWTLKFVGPFSVDAVRSLSFEWYMHSAGWNRTGLSDPVLCV